MDILGLSDVCSALCPVFYSGGLCYWVVVSSYTPDKNSLGSICDCARVGERVVLKQIIIPKTEKASRNPVNTIFKMELDTKMKDTCSSCLWVENGVGRLKEFWYIFF